MRGRFWLAASLLTLALGAGVPGVVAQPGEKVARIGVLSGVRPDTDMTEGCTSFLRRGLQELGYIEGQTLRLEVRWSDGLVEPFPRLAADLVRRNVDVIAVTSTAIEAAKHATSTIPLVMTSSSYPVERGFIASLARPGGNITGLATHTGQLMAKRVQILKEAIPAASRLAVLRIPGHVQDLFVSDIEAAAKQVGMELRVMEVRRADDLPAAFEAAVRDRAQAVMSTQAPFFALHRVQMAGLALKHRLPSLSGEVAAPEAGTLLFHGPNIFEGCRRSATYVDRILKGAKPGDLPVEQPTKYELVVNLKTARTLGLTLPQSILLRADRVIE